MYDTLLRDLKTLHPPPQISGLPPAVLRAFRSSLNKQLAPISLDEIPQKLVNALFPFQKEGVL